MVLNMKRKKNCKILVVAVTLLFFGLAVQPCVAEHSEHELEAKDFLFQTILDISNNPDIKNLLEQNCIELMRFDIDRCIYRKILFSDPSLFCSMLFTKPVISYDYLDKTYNNGIRVTNILGENSLLEIVQNNEVTDAELFYEINNIISENEELSNCVLKIKNLKMDFTNNVIISLIKEILFVLLGISMIITSLICFPIILLLIPLNIYEDTGQYPILALLGYIGGYVLSISVAVMLITFVLWWVLFMITEY